MYKVQLQLIAVLSAQQDISIVFHLKNKRSGKVLIGRKQWTELLLSEGSLVTSSK
jgi:hypothetical protein